VIPIYPTDQEWPPASESTALRLYREHGAWYGGDPDELQTVYSGSQANIVAATAPRSGGLRGVLSRFWWGKTESLTQVTTRLHVPIAADLSTLSADLLYADLPQFRIPAEAEDGKLSTAEKKLQTALDKIVDESGLAFVLPESAEIGSAYGGRYIGTRVDVTVSPDSPMFYTIPPDAAVPEWRYGRLVAVTFWRVVDGPVRQKVWRHLERHEVVGGQAMIYHALFCGSEVKLGMVQELTLSEATRDLASKVDTYGGIEAGCTVLDVQYVPNIRPHRLIRGSALGRSDYSGAEITMDALDETMSSWQRDIRNGKGRILVPPEYLTSLGKGQGSEFDVEREVFQKINMFDPSGGAIKPEVVQFAIRTADHAATCAQHVRTIVRAAGLSQGSFGEEVDGGQATAKEVGERKSRTTATRAKKISYETFALRMILFAAMEQAQRLIGGTAYQGIAPKRPDIEFADAAAPDMQTLALTIKTISDAKAASTQTLVEMLHPEWDEERVLAEVAKIEDVQADPDQFDGGFGGGAGGGEIPPGGDDEEDDTEPSAR
jgi:hypothetical protein